jgi:hypothetical protein
MGFAGVMGTYHKPRAAPLAETSYCGSRPGCNYEKMPPIHLMRKSILPVRSETRAITV